MIVKLEPDLAVTACTLSNRFPGAGAFVKARVDVENRGLVSSPMDQDGKSAAGVRIIYRRADGTETVEGEEDLPVLDPGEKATVEFDLEMPLDPVRLRAEASPNPVDRDRSNDARECFFGAPEPTGFVCSTVALPMASGEPVLARELVWSNPALFDEISLYRDGAILAALPGAATMYVDRFTDLAEHTYEIRSRIGASKSALARLRCKLEPPETFRRGDVDGNAEPEITDAITLLGFLFLGGVELACPDAADVDDNGELEITDAIRILTYLFLGDDPPPFPGPRACGGDPTADTLDPCDAGCQ